MRTLHYILFAISIISCLSRNPIHAQPGKNYKKVSIDGLEVLKEDFLIQTLHLDTLPSGKNHFRTVATRINRFYHKKGYYLAITYLKDETATTLHIFVDEGRLGRIVFKNLNSLRTIAIRYDFELEGDVYNKTIVEKELRRLKKKYSFKRIYAQLERTKEYKKETFQLDDTLKIPYFGETTLPFFDKYGYRYNLIIHIQHHDSASKRGFGYGLKTHYTKGFIPYISYSHPSLLFKRDRAEARTSMGIFYLFDLKPMNIPYWTYVDLNLAYYPPPRWNDIYTPRIRSTLYRSRSGRSDLGVSKYEYSFMRGVVEPGITLLKKFKIYLGLGGEKFYFFDSEIDEDADIVYNVESEDKHWTFFEGSIEFDNLEWKEIGSNKISLELKYTYYLNHTSFNEASADVHYTYFLNHYSHIIGKMSGEKVWKQENVPFHHEISVSDAKFKGFMGKSYYSRHIAKAAHNYRLSIYKDHQYIGLYCDLVYFIGSEYDLEGRQYGIVAGPSWHIIFLDQFNFDLYFGKDYLFSEKESQYNMYLHLSKKW